VRGAPTRASDALLVIAKQQPDNDCRADFLVVGRALKQLILGSRSFHFAVNRIHSLEGVRRQGFRARMIASKSVLRNARLKKQLFSP
jgi:hypothetical protein